MGVAEGMAGGIPATLTLGQPRLKFIIFSRSCSHRCSFRYSSCQKKNQVESHTGGDGGGMGGGGGGEKADTHSRNNSANGREVTFGGLSVGDVLVTENECGANGTAFYRVLDTPTMFFDRMSSGTSEAIIDVEEVALGSLMRSVSSVAIFHMGTPLTAGSNASISKRHNVDLHKVVSFNYRAGGADQSLLHIAGGSGDTIQCRECYAHASLSVRIEFDMDWSGVSRFSTTISGSIEGQFQYEMSLGAGASVADKVDVWESPIKLLIGGIDLGIASLAVHDTPALVGRVTASTDSHTTAFMRAGFRLPPNVASAGVTYTKRSKWRRQAPELLLRGPQLITPLVNLDSTSPSVGYATGSVGFGLRHRIELSASVARVGVSIGADVTLGPDLAVTASGCSSPCEFGTWKLTPSLGAFADLDIAPSYVSLDPPGFLDAFQFHLNRNPLLLFSADFGPRLSLSSSTRCSGLRYVPPSPPPPPPTHRPTVPPTPLPPTPPAAGPLPRVDGAPDYALRLHSVSVEAGRSCDGGVDDCDLLLRGRLCMSSELVTCTEWSSTPPVYNVLSATWESEYLVKREAPSSTTAHWEARDFDSTTASLFLVGCYVGLEDVCTSIRTTVYTCTVACSSIPARVTIAPIHKILAGMTSPYGRINGGDRGFVRVTKPSWANGFWYELSVAVAEATMTLSLACLSTFESYGELPVPDTAPVVVRTVNGTLAHYVGASCDGVIFGIESDVTSGFGLTSSLALRVAEEDFKTYVCSGLGCSVSAGTVLRLLIDYPSWLDDSSPEFAGLIIRVFAGQGSDPAIEIEDYLSDELGTSDTLILSNIQLQSLRISSPSYANVRVFSRVGGLADVYFRVVPYEAPVIWNDGNSFVPAPYLANPNGTYILYEPDTRASMSLLRVGGSATCEAAFLYMNGSLADFHRSSNNQILWVDRDPSNGAEDLFFDEPVMLYVDDCATTLPHPTIELYGIDVYDSLALGMASSLVVPSGSMTVHRVRLDEMAHPRFLSITVSGISSLDMNVYFGISSGHVTGPNVPVDSRVALYNGEACQFGNIPPGCTSIAGPLSAVVSETSFTDAGNCQISSSCPWSCSQNWFLEDNSMCPPAVENYMVRLLVGDPALAPGYPVSVIVSARGGTEIRTAENCAPGGWTIVPSVGYSGYTLRFVGWCGSSLGLFFNGSITNTSALVRLFEWSDLALVNPIATILMNEGELRLPVFADNFASAGGFYVEVERFDVDGGVDLTWGALEPPSVTFGIDIVESRDLDDAGARLTITLTNAQYTFGLVSVTDILNTLSGSLGHFDQAIDYIAAAESMNATMNMSETKTILWLQLPALDFFYTPLFGASELGENIICTLPMSMLAFGHPSNGPLVSQTYISSTKTPSPMPAPPSSLTFASTDSTSTSATSTSSAGGTDKNVVDSGDNGSTSSLLIVVGAAACLVVSIVVAMVVRRSTKSDSAVPNLTTQAVSVPTSPRRAAESRSGPATPRGRSTRGSRTTVPGTPSDSLSRAPSSRRTKAVPTQTEDTVELTEL